MPVYDLGVLNTQALQTPDVYVQIVPPKRYINGVPTDIYGIVGIASWGAVNSPVLAGSIDDAQRLFGVQQDRKYDLATAAAIGFLNGASNQRLVRVTDGTDAAATVNLMDTNGTPAIGATLTGYYTGTLGNTITAAISAGTKQSTFKVTINLPGYTSEVFDNITGSGATLWNNIVAAINNGIGDLRPPSTLVVASRGAGTAAPNTATTYTLTGGTDGTTTLTDSVLIGQDGVTRKGMYALRGTGASLLNLVDLTDSTTWATIEAFAKAEGMFAVVQGSSGQSYSTVSTSLNTSGVDSRALKVLVGDWCYYYDPILKYQRLIAPATFVCAKYAALSPQFSALNKPIAGIIGTQRSVQKIPYSSAEIAAIVGARLDVITNPCPGGNYYGLRTGHNTMSDPARRNDTYSRMINFIAFTIAASMGWVIGTTHTQKRREDVKAMTETWLQNLADPNINAGEPYLADPNGGIPYKVKVDAENNPDSMVARGYLIMDVQAKFAAVIEFFIINLEGGQTVQITTANG